MSEQPSAAQTVRHIAKGLLPWRGDVEDLADFLQALLDALRPLSRLVYRVVLMALFPLSIVVLYPFVREAQRKQAALDLDEERRRAELIAELTKCSQKPIEWPSDWTKQIDPKEPT